MEDHELTTLWKKLEGIVWFYAREVVRGHTTKYHNKHLCTSTLMFPLYEGYDNPPNLVCLGCERLVELFDR